MEIICYRNNCRTIFCNIGTKNNITCININNNTMYDIYDNEQK